MKRILQLMAVALTLTIGSALYLLVSAEKDIPLEAAKNTRAPDVKFTPTPQDVVEKILELAEYVDEEQLYDCSIRSKIRFSELVREKFWLWDKVKLQKFRLELECVYEFRNNYFII